MSAYLRGCKNLVDVLKSKAKRKVIGEVGPKPIGPDELPAVTRGESYTGGIADIEKYVAKTFESRARMLMLIVTPPDEHFTLNVDRVEDGSMDAWVVVQSGTAQEKAVRSFFARHDLLIPEESKEHGDSFVPGIPVQLMCTISPLPPDSARLSRLITDLFRDAFGLREDSQLRFQLYALEDAG